LVYQLQGGYIFSIVLREPFKFSRSKWARLITFLDDGIGFGVSSEEAHVASMFIKNQFQALSFVFANEKCEWIPIQERTWRGYIGTLRNFKKVRFRLVKTD
jgi:hypothetical protein